MSTDILFGTSNKHKLQEAKAILESHGFKIQQYEVDLLEIQDDSLERIAIISLEHLPVKGPLFVEDTGLFIESLNGFPGSFASYVFKTLGNRGILKLMKDEINREAYFESYIAYKSTSGTIVTFRGKCKGKISTEIRGTEWGYDPIFIPHDLNSNDLTFSELGEEIKNTISHRSLALKSLRTFLIKK